MKDKKQTAAIAGAVEQLLAAAGLDIKDADLVDTPRRVAELWSDEFLSGYRMDAAAILADGVVDESEAGLVIVSGLSFHSMCPHHLLPAQGRAHVAYLPAGRLLGFGQVARLVACFTQRLTLQERATQQIVRALVDHLPARGAGCVLESQQSCLAIPGDRHHDSRVVTSAFAGELEQRAELQGRLLALCDR